MTKPNVVIDGETYLPATEVLANRRAIMEALVEIWWGDVSKKSDEELEDMASRLRVLVSDTLADYDFDGDELLDVVNAVAEAAQRHQSREDSSK